MKHDPTRLQPVPMRVLESTPENADTTTLVLDCDPSCPIVPGAPGQFNMLYAFGVGEVAISISGTSDDRRQMYHTVRAVAPVSDALCRMRPGDWVGVRGPFGVGWPMLQARGRDVILVAGGIGMAPLRPAVQAVLRERAAFGRLLVFYGARAPRDRLFVSELARWESSRELELGVTVDNGGGNWGGRVGFVVAALGQAQIDPARAIAMTCGPEVMMRAVTQHLLDRGMAASDIYVSMERNMKCATALCGHCQFGPEFVCKDGPVLPYDRIADLLTVREI